jgi:hypothetical protein
MQSVGAAWLMVSLNGGQMYVALTQTASPSRSLFLLCRQGQSHEILF